MLQHALVVGAALAVSLWSTIVTQYYELRGITPPPERAAVVEEVPLAAPSAPTPLETVVADIVRAASSTIPAAAPPASIVPAAPAASPPVLVIPPVTPVLPSLPPPAPVAPSIDTQLASETLLQNAIVNIICVQGGGLKGSSGSGVVIDPRGIILTVAHVAQHFLLRDYPEPGTGSCYIRTGSPARNAYTAELVYISPSWIAENDSTFLSARPRGTGEDDFAFLALTGSLSGASTGALPHIPLAPPGTDVEIGDRVGTASYAAEFLTSSEVRSSLYPTIRFAPIDDVFTFARNTIDIFSVAAGSAAQEGSSGGVVMNEDRQAIGVISTRTVKPDLSLRTLQALTPDHLRRSFRRDMGEDLDSYLRDSLPVLVGRFSPKAKELQGILFNAIDRAQ